jgi:pseudouridine-5'-phosphate glycosidase
MTSLSSERSDYFRITPRVSGALKAGQAVVALESTVISHGLPHPLNLDVACLLEAIIRQAGAEPATIGIINGVVTVGVDEDGVELLALGEGVRKVSRRDFGIAAACREHGATTVAGTMIAAHWAGIRVFATGGIGGVHRGDTGDVSADLPELARTPVAVVCAGAKSILDLPRTLEWLETAGVPVIGYQTDEFPAFYARTSGLPVDARVDSAEEAAAILGANWALGLEGGVLIVVPPPADAALDYDDMERAVQQALDDASRGGIGGKALTPFLLSRVAALTEGRSVDVNVALLEQNARVAAEIALALVRSG